MSVDTTARGLALGRLARSGGAMTGAITGTAVTVTASAPVLDMSQTWNNAGVTFTGWKFNVTNTASAAASLLIDLQVGAVSQFAVSRVGYLTAIGGGLIGGCGAGAQTGGTFAVLAAGKIGFVSASDATAAPDTYFTRSAAGALVANGSLASTTYLKSQSTTVSGLTAAATAGAGARAFVTDATVTTFASTVVGGGANAVPVVSTGAAWIIG